MTNNYVCSICKAPLTLRIEKDYTRCSRCGVVRTIYKYDATLYKENYATNYIKYAETPTNIPLNLFRLGLVSRWLKTDDKILDIGCCIGEFIRFAEQYYTCIGFEPNVIAAGIAEKRVDSKIVTSPPWGKLQFDCVTMFDVFEHIEGPIAFLELLRDVIKPDGILVITTPNVTAIPNWADDQLRAWKHWKPTEHLWLYTEQALELMISKIGFKLLHIGSEESDIRPGNPNGDILTFVARKI